MLPRTLEPEVMDSTDEANEYDAMDHQAVNEAFAEDFLAIENIGSDCLDLGTGTALIPIEICQRNPDIRIMAMDASMPMLELARYRLELANMTDRIQLLYGNVCEMPFEGSYFDAVVSNSLIHHLADPAKMLAEAWRVLRPKGLLFIRDLVRPETDEAIEELVEAHTQGESQASKQLLRQSFHAALTLAEIRELLGPLGITSDSVQMTSNRHWTIHARKSIDE
jgi:ubiquinone/menaquinone biosynthesis C-methylase UbiE